MKSFCVQYQTLLVTIFAISSFFAIHVSAQAQSSPNPRAAGAIRREEKMQRQNEQYERDNLERELASGTRRPHAGKNSEALAQVKQDFEKLQARYNKIVLGMASKQGLDHHAVLQDVSDIKKSASRLKTNLALPEPEVAHPKTTTVATPLEESLLKLQKFIYDFVTNPLFDNAAAYDVEQAKKAGADLREIIFVSQCIVESVDKHKKAH